MKNIHYEIDEIETPYDNESAQHIRKNASYV